MKPLAVALVLVAVAACSGPDAGRPPPAPAPPGPATSAPAPARAALQQLPVGPPPRTGHVVGTTYVARGGGGFELPPSRFALGGVDAFRGGLLVDDGRYFEGTSGLSVVTADGVEELDGCTSGGGAAHGDTVAWATFACPESGVPAPTVLHLRTADGERTQRLEDRAEQGVLTAVVGLLDGDVLLSRGSGTRGVLRSDLVGAPRRITGLAGVRAVDGRSGLLVGVPDTDGRGVVVLDTRAGRRLWHDRRWGAVALGPGGRLLGWSRRGGWTVRDARTGAVRHVLAVPRGLGIHGLVWEDRRHLLGVARPPRGGGRQAIVRLGLDGSIERTTPVVRPGRRTGYLLAH
ncbi:hypothetical protein [Nocardioides dongxiaopingii]|uniref:hypothetical protein n=1 Tax=Nocardioides dongxiaopingii TaxID=2576036 RepID=UPI0010C76B67|nr:hypothetical protein [Nocardioides dongxiaopingii]